MKHTLTARHLVAVLRRQPKHMQRVYAVIFSASVTLLLAVLILYIDYGFWHEKYSRTEEIRSEQSESIQEAQIDTASPGDMLKDFAEEAAKTFKQIDTSPSKILQGKEVYTKDAATTTEEGR